MTSKLVKALGVGTLALAIGFGVFGCKWAEERAKEKQKPQRIELGVTDYILLDGISLYYNGMNTGSTFALSDSAPNAVNMFYPAKPGEEINFYGRKFKIIGITPEHLVFEREN
jgi:hypothetical protein